MKRQPMLLVAAGVFAVVAGIIFLYNNFIIPKVRMEAEQKVRLEIDDKAMPKARVAVVDDKAEIPRYTVLTEDTLSSKVKLVEIPIKYVAKGAAIDMDMIRGKVTKEDLRPGEQVLLDSLSSEKKWFGEYERLKEYAVTSIVAGEVKTGNIIDIVVSYGNGEYSVVVPKIKVKKLIDDSGKNEAAGTEKSGVARAAEAKAEYTLIIAVDEEQYRDLELAGKLGKLQTRLYIDESQPASIKTFEFTSALNKFRAENDSKRRLEEAGIRRVN